MCGNRNSPSVASSRVVGRLLWSWGEEETLGGQCFADLISPWLESLMLLCHWCLPQKNGLQDGDSVSACVTSFPVKPGLERGFRNGCRWQLSFRAAPCWHSLTGVGLGCGAGGRSWWERCAPPSPLTSRTAAVATQEGGCCKDTTACQVSRPQHGARGEEAEDTLIWGVAAPATSRYLAPTFWWDSESGLVKQQFSPRTQSGAHLLIPLNSHQTIMTFSQCCSFEQMPRGERICIPLLAPWTSWGPRG